MNKKILIEVIRCFVSNIFGATPGTSACNHLFQRENKTLGQETIRIRINGKIKLFKYFFF